MVRRDETPRSQLGVGGLIISDKEKQYVNEVLDSNRLSYGPFSRRFEAEFARLHGARYGILSNSGTSSLQVGLAALKERYGWRDGDEIIVPAITFVATSNIVLMLNLRPVFVDVDPKSYNMDPGQIAPRITERTRAIIPVHMFGLPAPMEPIMSVATAHDLRVMEDSCEAMFVRAYGRPVGSFGEVACFSTYVAHLLVTGVGGLAITNDQDLAITMRSLCNHGRDGIYLSIDDDEDKEGDELQMIVRGRFNFVRLGYSYRVTELEAALGVAQLEARDEIIRQRKKNAEHLIAGLSPLQKKGWLQLPTVPEWAEHAFMLFPIVVSDPSTSRDELVMHLEQAQIETRPMMPLINQPLYVDRFGNLEEQYPVARWINENGFYIGCHQWLQLADLEYIVDTFHDFFAA